MTYLLTAAGLVLLLGGAELMVRGAVSLAAALKMPTFVVGMTVVAFGTSTPELLIALNAALEESKDIAVGNVIGANIANILLIVGASALCAPVAIETRPSRIDAVGLLIATGLFLALAYQGVIGRTAGAALLVFFVGFIAISVLRRRVRGSPDPTDVVRHYATARHNVVFSLALVGGGISGLVIGGNFAVQGAVGMAETFGISQTVIGLTVVAIGTTLPELAASTVASLRGEPDVALGNVIGSNIFNITGVVGLVGVISPMAIPDRIFVADAWVLTAATVLLGGAMLASRKLGKVEGGLFIGCYVVLIAAILAVG